MINGKTIIVDASSWQRYYPMNYDAWADNGIDGVILKGGEGDVTKEMWEKVVKSRLAIKGMYFWNFPLWNTDAQVEFYSNEIKTYRPNLWALDIEQWWIDYDEYLSAIHGTLPWDQVRKIPQSAINNSARGVWNGLFARHPSLYRLKYSAEWFVRGYCPQINTWINDGPSWIALYGDLWKGARRVTWEEITPPLYDPIYDRTNPAEYAGWTEFQANTWDLWQFSSTLIIPGETYALDCNVFNGTLDELKLKCGLVVKPPAPPKEQPFKNYLPHISK
jgi:hypothetical protein